MIDTSKEVLGRVFRTRADYDAALRDKHKIEQIKSKTDLTNREEIFKLYREIQENVYQFETILGRDFDDEIYELTEQLKKEENITKGGTSPKGKKGYTTGKKAKLQKTKQLDNRKLEDYDEAMQKQILYEIYMQEKKRKRIQIIAMILSIVCIGYFAGYYYYAEKTDSDYAKLSALKDKAPISGNIKTTVTLEGEKDAPDILEQYKTLYNKNKKLIGWIKIADTNIDYPVMQTSNNEYYLTHNYEQKEDRNGSIFLDADCNVIDRSTNLIVYGHNMKSGKMFGELANYSSENFYKEHKKIQFDTIYEEGTYEVMYVFRGKIYMDNEVTFKYYQFIDATSEEEFNSNMKAMKEMAMYDTGVTAVYGDELLTLSTCDTKTDVRFVVVAKRIE